MSFRRRTAIEEIINLQIHMSQQVAKRDKEYSYYVGAFEDDAYEMALIDAILKVQQFKQNKIVVESLKLYRLFLDQKRKASFDLQASEISRMGLILGETRTYKNATDSS